MNKRAQARRSYLPANIHNRRGTLNQLSLEVAELQQRLDRLGRSSEQEDLLARNTYREMIHSRRSMMQSLSH